MQSAYCHIVACPAVHKFYNLSDKQQDFKKKTLLNIKRVLIFSITLI
jgi:uncharacterized protein YbaR (Trm112 family)